LITERPNRPTVRLRKPGFTSSATDGVRWWPLLLIVVAAIGYAGLTWTVRDIQRQDKIIHSAGAGVVGLILGSVWCVLFSRLKWHFRLSSIILLILSLAALWSSLKFRSFNGDMIPQFDWKWNVAMEKINPTKPTKRVELIGDSKALGVYEFPQFLGPDRDAIVAGPNIARDWTSEPPRQIWRRSVGSGWAGFSTSGSVAVTIEQEGENEIVSCYELLTGEPVWRHSYPARFDSSIGGIGPRTVPAIVENRVYALGATGVLTCLDLANGRSIWSKNILKINNAPLPDWGVAGSPLVVGKKVIVSAGGSNENSLVAYDTETGDKTWGGGVDRASYSSPIFASLAGTDQVLIFNEPGISSHAVADGGVLWKSPWGNGHPHVAVPKIVGSNMVFLSSGYGVGSELLRIEASADGNLAAEQVWKSLRMKAKFCNVARVGDFIYGMDDGIMACLDLKDGSRRWKEGRYGHGQLLVVGDLMLITTEKGEVVLFEPNPNEPRELGRFTAFDHKLWNPPALAGQLLILRTDREAACYLLPVADTSDLEAIVDQSAAN
jgi:outer membrane protein assembly factor BamB